MPTPFESAQLNLQLFDMRREPELRAARSWFITEFHPDNAEAFFSTMVTDKHSWVRMVMGYWDMAASMVVFGAIDRDMFLAAHGEIFGTFCKVHPFLADIRARMSPAVLKHVEAVVMASPDAEAELAKRRARLKGMWDARQAAAEARAQAAATAATA